MIHIVSLPTKWAEGWPCLLSIQYRWDAFSGIHAASLYLEVTALVGTYYPSSLVGFNLTCVFHTWWSKDLNQRDTYTRWTVVQPFSHWHESQGPVAYLKHLNIKRVGQDAQPIFFGSILQPWFLEGSSLPLTVALECYRTLHQFCQVSSPLHQHRTIPSPYNQYPFFSLWPSFGFLPRCYLHMWLIDNAPTMCPLPRGWTSMWPLWQYFSWRGRSSGFLLLVMALSESVLHDKLSKLSTSWAVQAHPIRLVHLSRCFERGVVVPCLLVRFCHDKWEPLYQSHVQDWELKSKGKEPLYVFSEACLNMYRLPSE